MPVKKRERVCRADKSSFPDYINTAIMAFSAAAGVLEEQYPAYASNLRRITKPAGKTILRFLMYLFSRRRGGYPLFFEHSKSRRRPESWRKTKTES